MKIGTDITKNSRMTLALASKFLTENEMELMDSITEKSEKLIFASGRFAAKESIFKTLDNELPLTSIEILWDPSGAPIVFISGKKSSDISVSISHEDEYSIATAIRN